MQCATGLSNCSVNLADLDEFVGRVEGFPDDTFDLVIVDGQDSATMDRVDCVVSAAPKVKPRGHLVLDDSDNRRYAAVDGILQDWPARRFSGMKPYPLVATETSIYRRPG